MFYAPLRPLRELHSTFGTSMSSLVAVQYNYTVKLTPRTGLQPQLSDICSTFTAVNLDGHHDVSAPATVKHN